MTGLVALRGDPPAESGAFRAHEDGFQNTVELVGALADLDAFRLFVGAYPQTHPEAADAAQNIDWLKQKLTCRRRRSLDPILF